MDVKIEVHAVIHDSFWKDEDEFEDYLIEVFDKSIDIDTIKFKPI